MIKRFVLIILVGFSFVFSGCSCSKEELLKTNSSLIEEKAKLNSEIEAYLEVEKLFNFYNNITVNNVKSFVLVESYNEINGRTLYSDGVVVARNGYYYYIVTDYASISQSGIVSYKVTDSMAHVYNVNLSDSYDATSGLILLIVDSSDYSNEGMEVIEKGEFDYLSGHISSINQFNKIQVYTQIKTSTIDYNNTSYNIYNLNDNIISGSVINSSNKLCGFYMSRLNGFIDINLMKQIIYTTYSLIL